MKKRILHIIPSLDVGGAEADLVSKLRALREQYLFQVLALYHPGTLSGRLQELGIPVVNGHSNPWRWAQAIWDFRPQLIHSHMFPSHLVAQLARVLCPKASFVYTIQKEGHRAGRLEVLVERVLCHGDAHVLTSSRGVQSSYSERGVRGPQIKTVYNCIEPERLRGGSRAELEKLGLSGKPLVGTVGRLLPVKGQEYLLQAIPAILEKVPDAQFLFVGDGKSRAELRAIAENLGITKSVHWLGARTDICNFVPYLDVFVVPSLSESFCIAAAEASACGVPVVASNVGGLKEVIVDGKTGYLVRAKDPEALAEKICDLLGNASSRAAMGERAREHARLFEVESLAKVLSDVYESESGARGGLA